MGDKKLFPRPGVDFELEHIKGLDVAAAHEPTSVHLVRTINARHLGPVTITCGEDAGGHAVWLVDYCDPLTGAVRCGWAYDRRIAEQWAEEWPKAADL